MRFNKTGKGYLIRLEKEEKLVASLIKFCRQTKIGGALSAKISFYNLARKEYESKEFNQTMEIASLVGNVALKDGEVFIHAHVVLAGADYVAYGGHLEEAVVAGTCEIFLQDLGEQISRSPEAETGLSLLDL